MRGAARPDGPGTGKPALASYRASAAAPGRGSANPGLEGGRAQPAYEQRFGMDAILAGARSTGDRQPDAADGAAVRRRPDLRAVHLRHAGPLSGAASQS